MAQPTINEGSLTAVEACPAEVREILHAAMCGTELTFKQGVALATKKGSALEALVAVADQFRRETVGDAITYVVNRNINFTNVCFVGCSFCGFGRGPGAPDAYSLSFEEVVRRARQAWERGATEVCVQGGLPRDLDGFFYRDLLRAIKHAIPGMHVHAFSPMEIDYGVTKTGMLLRDYLRMMKDEGLGSIPGTAAEILDDRVRKELSPNKLPAGRWVEIITTAHELGISTTSTMMYGHVEEPADWVRHMLLLRAIQKRTSGFTEFVPLRFIHENQTMAVHFEQAETRPAGAAAATPDRSSRQPRDIYRRRLLSDSHASTSLTCQGPAQREEEIGGCADFGRALCAGRGHARGHHSRGARRALRGKDFYCHELRARHAVGCRKSVGDSARAAANFREPFRGCRFEALRTKRRQRIAPPPARSPAYPIARHR